MRPSIVLSNGAEEKRKSDIALERKKQRATIFAVFEIFQLVGCQTTGPCSDALAPVRIRIRHSQAGCPATP